MTDTPTPPDVRELDAEAYAAARAAAVRPGPRLVPVLPDARTISDAEYRAACARLGYHRQSLMRSAVK